MSGRGSGPPTTQTRLLVLAPPSPPPLPHTRTHTHADSLLALSDLRQGRKSWANHAALLALAGLLSGCISAYKNWPGVQR